MAVEMALKRIIISEIQDDQFVELKEVGGNRRFTIVIGMFEATSIDRRVHKFRTNRPLTHDLVRNVIEALGGEIEDIVITELRDRTYFAKIRIMKDGELIEVDSRPSDAIAVAVTVGAPIFVSEDVLDEVIGG